MNNAVSTSDKQRTDEQAIEEAWQSWLTAEEEACWAILEREYVAQKPAEPVVIYGVIDLSREVR